MLTPKFSLSQNDDYIFIYLHVPHIKLAETECHVEDDEFLFYSRPYYLRLHLPGNIVENDRTTSTYESGDGLLSVRISKANQGEHFEGLDLLTKLLTPKQRKFKEQNNVEVIDTELHGRSTGTGAGAEASQHQGNCLDLNPNLATEGSSKIEDTESDSEFDWYIEQATTELDLDLETLSLSKESRPYGFANLKTQKLNSLLTEIPDLIDLKNPDLVSIPQRKCLRQEHEKNFFNCEHYLADFFDDELINEFVGVEYPELTGIKGETTFFSDLEKEKLLQLPRREYIIEGAAVQTTYLGLVDLIFSYAYDFRATCGEHNVESDWTICKLSSSLSWLDSFENLRDVVIASARRSLCFPLYRNWQFFNKVLMDVKIIFEVGISQILKCLLGIHTVLSHSETYHPLNNIFITDYCVWIQTADTKRIQSLSKALNELKISKSDFDFQLNEMEADATQLMNDCEGEKLCNDDSGKGEVPPVDQLVHAMSKVVKVNSTIQLDSDDENSSAEDSSDSDADSSCPESSSSTE